MRSQRPWVGAMPKPSAPITAPLWMTQRSPTRQPAAIVTRGCSKVSAPTRESAPMTLCAPICARSPITAPRSITTNGPTTALGETVAWRSTKADGWMSAAGDGRRRFAHHCVRRAKYR